MLTYSECFSSFAQCLQFVLHIFPKSDCRPLRLGLQSQHIVPSEMSHTYRVQCHMCLTSVHCNCLTGGALKIFFCFNKCLVEFFELHKQIACMVKQRFCTSSAAATYCNKSAHKANFKSSWGSGCCVARVAGWCMHWGQAQKPSVHWLNREDPLAAREVFTIFCRCSLPLRRPLCRREIDGRNLGVYCLI